MKKKKPQNSPNDMSHLLDDLFSEAVDAVESVKKDSSKKNRATDHSEFDISEDDELSFEVEIELDNSPSKQEEDLSISLDDLFNDSQPVPTENNELFSDDTFDSEESSEEDDKWKTKFLEMEIKYKKAKRASNKRKKMLEELMQKQNTTKIELFQQKGFVEKTQGKLEQTQRQLRRYSTALGQANVKIEDMEERIENFEKGQTRQRKLLQKERDDQKKYGHGKPILKLIPTLDNLKLALAHTDSEKEVFIKGVVLAVQKFEVSLSKLGITSIDASLGTDFNPEIHEAMLKVPREDMLPNKIIDEIQSGFMIQDRLLRAARVSVSSRAKRASRRNRKQENEQATEKTSGGENSIPNQQKPFVLDQDTKIEENDLTNSEILKEDTENTETTMKSQSEEISEVVEESISPPLSNDSTENEEEKDTESSLENAEPKL